ncbi:MAG: PEGA domain-containing protein [Sandaracinaceae bacterium]|nr:PEGA domain-containing protein [Sandaracinaceae bacterium]
MRTHPFAVLTACAALGLALGLSLFTSDAHAQRVVTIPVNIESVPPGATVYVDSPDTTPVGVTPITAARIASGSHTLIFRLANYEEARLVVTVARRRETFRAVLRALGSVEVSAANEGARGATVTVDGQPVAGGILQMVPLRVDNLPPGRHQIRAMRDGFNAFEQWVEVQGGEVVRVPIILERAAPTTGSILVAADIEGAPIFLDGRPTGLVTTAVIDDVPAGNHTIEVRPSEGQPFSQTIVVEAGRRAEVRAHVRPTVQAATTGTIAVLVDQSGALVRINGTNLPPGTYSREGLPPGSYVVQVLLEGFEPFRREVTVTAGQTTTVDVALTGIQAPPGPISIRVNVPGARVFVDDHEFSTPYVARDPAGGSHAIRVTADGYREQSFTCNNTNGSQDCSRDITLEAQQVGLRVAITHSLRPGVQGRLFVDDADVGPVPYDGNIGIGSHIISVRAEGYQAFEQQVNVQLGEGDVQMEVTLVDSSDVAAAASTTHSALPTPINHPMIDASIGWPYFLELRLGIGVHELIDAGFAVRTFGRLTEFEGRVRFGTQLGDIRQLAAGAQLRFGGGIGPDTTVRAPHYGTTLPAGVCNPVDAMAPAGSRQCANQDLDPTTNMADPSFTSGVNTFFLSLDANVSLILEPLATVTLWLGMDLSTDQYAGHARDSSAFADFGPSADRICHTAGMTGGPMIGINCGRQDMARLRLGGSIEFNIDRNWGVWGIFEGVLAQSADHRRVYSDIIGQATDIRIYPRLGLTYKF